MRHQLSLALALLIASQLTANAQKRDMRQDTGFPTASNTKPEQLDLDMYSRIRDEGFKHSHVMEYASALFDDIGPRLTGSPAMARANEWTKQQLTAMGCSNAHLESWGDFGMAWTQISASLDMVKPVPAVFLAQATPWSPATQGPVTADLISVPGLNAESDFARWKGKLKGKIVLYGLASSSPEVNPDSVPTVEHYNSSKLKDLSEFPLSEPSAQSQTDLYRKIFAGKAFQEKVAKLFASEGAIAVLEPGGSGGILHDDTNSSMGWYVYRADRKQTSLKRSLPTKHGIA